MVTPTNTLPATGFASAKTLAQLLETTPSTIWRWTAKGKLPRPIRLGEGTTRWDLAQVNAALEKIKEAA